MNDIRSSRGTYEKKTGTGHAYDGGVAQWDVLVLVPRLFTPHLPLKKGKKVQAYRGRIPLLKLT